MKLGNIEKQPSGENQVKNGVKNIMKMTNQLGQHLKTIGNNNQFKLLLEMFSCV